MEQSSFYKKVLIVDDNKMDNLLGKMILSSINFSREILTFENPLEAYKYFEKIDTDHNTSENHPEVLFLDINMPFISGFELLNKLQHLSHPSIKNCRVYMLSSSDELEDINKAKSVKNVVGFLHKPLSKDDLMEKELGD